MLIPTIFEVAEKVGISCLMSSHFKQRFRNEACLNQVHSMKADKGAERKPFICDT
jgi:hypothetical protein